MDHLLELVEATSGSATPLLAIDDRIVTSNVRQMQERCERAGVALRPHLKTHKSSAIAARQIDAGAVGLTVATLSEAVGLGEAGISTDVFLSTPVFFDRPRRALLERVVELHAVVSVAVDGQEGLASLSSAPAAVGVLVELDSGLDRTGTSVVSGVGLARVAGDRFRGFFTHGGHGYLPGSAEAAGADEVRILAAASGEIGGDLVLSAGSTPTVGFSSRSPVTEQRPGTYVFGDRQQAELGAIGPTEVAAAVVTTVMHVSGDKVVVDAGAKVLTKDRAPFLDGHGHVLGESSIVIDRLNDQHGMGRVTSGPGPAVGDRLVIVPNHVCPVVNLFDEAVLVGDGGATPLAIDLRGLPT